MWSWFAAAESHNRLSQNQANMVEVPGLSYGLFHAVAQPIYSWGVVRQVKFPGVNLDIGHIRNLGWAKDNDKQKWIGYNRLRGQYMSALEHAIPERFFNDPAQCNAEGSTSPIAGLPACPKGVSAVQAIGVAAQARVMGSCVMGSGLAMTHLLSEDHFEEAKKISGDLLTATIWSWFAASESHNRLSQKQANMVENPGLFHAVALPVYGWGVVRQVKFPGVNLDIGRVRATGWARDNNRQKWIGYNRLRGQYMSALEHAIPERFFNDPAQCNAEGSTTRWAHGSSPFIVSSGQAMDCGCLLARAQASDLRFRSCRGS